MNVVILLPTYNEKENIVVLLEALLRVVTPLKKHHFEILVIDDTSPDGTADEVKNFQAAHKNIKIIIGKKEGLGKALTRGTKHALNFMDADVIIQMDADLSHDPEVIPKFLDKLESGYDFVIGSRYISGGSIPSNWGIHRKVYSIIGNSIVRYGLGKLHIHDWTGGYRAYDKKYVEMIAPYVEKYNGYIFQIAFLHKAVEKGAHIAEVPIHFTDRQYGKSKIIFTEYIWSVFDYIISERFQHFWKSSFKKFLVVGFFGFIVNTITLEILVPLGVAPWLSGAIGAEMAIIFNFLLNNAWTFKARTVKGLKKVRKFIQFNMTSLGAIVIQSMTILLGTVYFGVNTYRYWYIIGISIALVWNYFMYSRVIWKK